MRILVTGDRGYTDSAKVEEVLNGLEITELIVGDADGADTLAQNWAILNDCPYRVFEADWRTFGRGAGPQRNAAMLEQQPDLVLAFHDDLASSKGTANCISQARRRGIPVTLIASGQRSMRPTPS